MILFLSIFFSFLIILIPFTAYPEDCQKAVDLYNKGTLSNDVKEKERSFKEAIRLCSDPEVLSRVYNNLGDLYEKKEEYSKALVHYRKAVEIKSDLATPYISVGDIFFKLRDYYSAFVMYGEGLKYNPEDEDAIKGRERSEEAFKKKMIIYFDLDSSKISDLYLYRLQLVGESIKNASDKIRIEVVGHTCNLGSRKHNELLSKRRAEAVSQYLREKYSSNYNSLATIGQGEENPLLPNRDNESRILNRRVEINILELF